MRSDSPKVAGVGQDEHTSPQTKARSRLITIEIEDKSLLSDIRAYLEAEQALIRGDLDTLVRASGRISRGSPVCTAR